MNLKDRERIKNIIENGNGYVTIQQNLAGKNEGQTQFKVEAKKGKSRHYPEEKKGGLENYVTE